MNEAPISDLAAVTAARKAGQEPELPGSTPTALAMLAAVAPNPQTDRKGYLDHQFALNLVLGSPAYPTAEPVLREMAGLVADRSYHPAGAARRLAAGRGAGRPPFCLTPA